MVQTAKNFMAEKDIFSSPNRRPGKVLPPATADTVKQFYPSNEISRIMPGTKDYISVNSEGTKVHLRNS
jgi:hypothetical protein